MNRRPAPEPRGNATPLHRLVPILLLGLSFTWLPVWPMAAAQQEPVPQTAPDTEWVGPSGPNRFITPSSQILTPAGRQIYLPKARPQELP